MTSSLRACVQNTIAGGGGGGHYSRTAILLFASAGIPGKGGGGGGGGIIHYSLRALSLYFGRDTTYTMTMWAGLVRAS